jgi:PAS domain S-box-containing protein
MSQSREVPDVPAIGTLEAELAVLAASDRRHREIIEQAPCLILTLDAAGLITFANTFALDFLGYRRHILVGRPLAATVAPGCGRDDLADLVQGLARRAEDRVLIELEHQRADRSTVWISWAATVLRDPAGRAVGLTCVGLDMTDRRRAEESLRESESLYRAVFHENRAIKLLIDPDSGQILDANVAAEEFYGYGREKLLAMSIKDINVLASDHVQAHMQSTRDGRRQPLDFRHRLADGRIRDVAVFSGPVRSAGRTMLLSIISDVTEQKLAEEALRASEARYRAVVEDQLDLVCRMRPDGVLTFVNEAFARYFDREKPALLGRVFAPAMPAEDRARLLAQRAALGAEAPVACAEIRVVKPGVGLRWQEWVDRAILDDLGRVLEIQSVGRDVTERIEGARSVDALAREKDRLNASLEAVFQSIPDAIVCVDENLRLVRTNAALAGVCARAGELCPGELLERAGGYRHSACFKVLREVLEEKRPVVERRVVCRRGGKPGQVVVVNCVPTADSEGRFLGATLVIRDVTRLEELEKRAGDARPPVGLVGISPAMREIERLIALLADMDTTVLVSGESGTGKELVVEALHAAGGRAARPLIKVNCSALSESLLESELFGHTKGAFTGAVMHKVGRFEAAEGGTIFLDEIGDISARIQLKLLRFLDLKEYERVGESRTRKADVRVVAATNVDLAEKVRRGQFREDLYYRLKVMVVPLPPLRERREDIPALAWHFVERFRQAMGKAIDGIGEAALGLLSAHHWPGNVRELKNVMEHACILCPGGLVGPGHLPRDLAATVKNRNPAAAAGCSPTAPTAIAEALKRCQGNKSRAAKLLGISRQTIYRKLAESESEA